MANARNLTSVAGAGQDTDPVTLASELVNVSERLVINGDDASGVKLNPVIEDAWDGAAANKVDPRSSPYFFAVRMICGDPPGVLAKSGF